LVSLDWLWPHPVIAVAAAPRPGGPNEVTLRFTVDGYPVSTPTATPWDATQDTPLNPGLWPTGGRVTAVFNPQWNAGALYIPCDRMAIAGHDPWKDQYRALLWDPTKDIVHYLKVVHELLHSAGYAGVRKPA
jgi:hypothetical protein